MHSLVAYVDGSFFGVGDFAGSAVYVAEHSPLNLEQYLPDEFLDKDTREKSALRAEVYAAVLAARQAFEISKLEPALV